jgi:hypothetical protein
MTWSRTSAERPRRSTCSLSTNQKKRGGAASRRLRILPAKADMTNMTDRETYLARAAEARADADAATLDNVRDRCLRSEAAWNEMAARAERTERMRQTLLAEKAKAAAALAAADEISKENSEYE